VASVTYRRPGLLGALPFSKWSKLDVSEELVKNGLATVYTQVNSNQVLTSSAVSFFGSVEAIH
jgi:endonuclease YncB( thermonuclease family)